jgi:epoxyqueuosine reductase
MGAAIQSSSLATMARECGLDDAAAVPAWSLPLMATNFGAAISGYPSELSYLSRGLQRRLSPSLVLEGVRTMILACVSYAGVHPGIEARPEGMAFVSRFAWGIDYHDAVGRAVNRLAEMVRDCTGTRTRAYVDTGPVLEKPWAAAASLGFIGRNHLLIHPRLGSFVFLGSILTDADVIFDTPRPALPDCGTCSACVSACPTQALSQSGQLDVSRCLAHVTVTSRQPVPQGLPLAGHLYGCDRCQDVCPYNHRATRHDREVFRPIAGLPFVAPSDVLAMNEAAFQKRFGTTPARRRGLAGMQTVAQALLEDQSGRTTS